MSRYVMVCRGGRQLAVTEALETPALKVLVGPLANRFHCRGSPNSSVFNCHLFFETQSRNHCRMA